MQQCNIFAVYCYIQTLLSRHLRKQPVECNCVVYNRTETSDERFLTDNDILPVTALQFGDLVTAPSTAGSHTDRSSVVVELINQGQESMSDCAICIKIQNLFLKMLQRVA